MRTILTVDDVLELLDGLFTESADRWTERGSGWWDGFYEDRQRPIPFFRGVPDESLVAWQREGQLCMPPGGRALDLGCGPGRNAVWLAQQGYEVDALDISETSLAWARERARDAGVRVRFVQASIFDWDADGYDLVYDSGCFHHLPPHRRISYRALLERALRPGGAFGLNCFAAGAMGSRIPDADLYRAGTLGGGLAYAADELHEIFSWLKPVELRRMRQMTADAALFGEPFLWAGLFRRREAIRPGTSGRRTPAPLS